MTESRNEITLLRKFLFELSDTKHLIEISRGKYDFGPVCGVVRKLDRSLVYVQLYDGTGLLDIMTVFFLPHVETVASMPDRTKMLLEENSNFLDVFQTLPDFKLNTIWNVAQWAQNRFKAVELYFEGIHHDITAKGKIIEQDLDYVLVQEYDEKGKIPKGKKLFERKFITRLEFGDIYR